MKEDFEISFPFTLNANEMVIISTGSTEKLYYQFYHSQRDACSGHKGNEWLRRTGNCDGEDKRDVDMWTKLQVSMSIPKEIPLALSCDNE